MGDLPLYLVVGGELWLLLEPMTWILSKVHSLTRYTAVPSKIYRLFGASLFDQVICRLFLHNEIYFIVSA